MAERNIFLSVGGTFTDAQEQFVRAVEDRLRIEGLIPHTVGRNTFSSEAPLKTVEELMDKCEGAVVLALERSYFQQGLDKRGGQNEKPLSDIKLPTPWNHIEAAMCYSRNLPLLVIVENGIKSEGLLEPGYDWYVQNLEPEPSSLNSVEFNGVLSSWKSRIDQFSPNKEKNPSDLLGGNPADLTIGQLVNGLKPTQLWSILAAVLGLFVGAFVFGTKFTGS
jgi:hypothetical protein